MELFNIGIKVIKIEDQRLSNQRTIGIREQQIEKRKEVTVYERLKN